MTVTAPSILTAAVLMDLAVGDPRWFPHPVVQIGRLITTLEARLERYSLWSRGGGALLLLTTVGAAVAGAWLLIAAARFLHPAAGVAAAAFLAYTSLAIRSLHHESALVAAALERCDLPEARRLLSFIVGRDTTHLEEADIWRALVETVAENTADGIVAPLFWLSFTGPVGAIAFKAVSTLDSMVGYKNDRYRDVGWASARMDDLLNLVPARLTALLMILAAPLAGLSARGALNITLRDRLNHASPNSGHPEAAAAGALGVQLGGTSTYRGIPSDKPLIGNRQLPLDRNAYAGMIRLMYLTTVLMTLVSLGICLVAGGLHVPHL